MAAPKRDILSGFFYGVSLYPFPACPQRPFEGWSEDKGRAYVRGLITGVVLYFTIMGAIIYYA